MGEEKKRRDELIVLGGLGLLMLMSRKRPAPSETGFAGFRTVLVEAPVETTTRKRDGAEAYDFWHFPLIRVTPDVNGDFRVDWAYYNYLDGAAAAVGEGIVNVFPGLRAGEPVTLELHDTRDPATTGRDPARGESIAYGDPDGLFDGVWHRFRSEVSVNVSSPSGAIASVGGVLDEVFRTVGVLVVEFAGFGVEEV